MSRTPRARRGTTSPGPASRAASSGARTLGPLLVASTFAALLAASWRRWGDPQIDVGLWMETARRLALGEVLQRDVVSLHGPLSHTLHALLLRAFGISTMTLVAFQICVLVAILGLLAVLLRRLAGPFVTTVALLLFLVAFAFGQRLLAGGYDYLTPYTPEITHGLLLGLGTLAAAGRAFDSGRPRDALLTGLLLGVTFLTKAEPFLAAAAAVAVGLVLAALAGRPWRSGGLVLAGALVPPLVAFGLFWLALAPAEALSAVLGPWVRMGTSLESSQPFYRITMGIFDLGWSARRILAAFGLWAGFLGGALAVAAVARRAGAREKVAAWGVLVPVGAALLWFRASALWLDAARAVPFLVAAVLLWLGLRSGGVPRTRRVDARGFREITFGVFALALTFKVFLNARFDHYGFVLLMPATLFLVVVLLDRLPDALGARFGAAAFRGAILTVVAVFGVSWAEESYLRRHLGRPCQLGWGADLMWTDERGCLVQTALVEIEKRAPKGATLSVLPDGALVNFLAWRRSSVPYLTLMPFDLSVAGEEKVLADLRRSPPDFILLMDRETKEQGFEAFGRSYARSIGTWIVEEYASEGVIGPAPFTGRGFGLELLRRRPRS